MMREKVEEILSRTNVAAEEIDALLAEFERVQARLAALELKLGEVHCDASHYASRCAGLERVQGVLVDALEDAGEMGDGEFRYCCMSRYGSKHAYWCGIGKALAAVQKPEGGDRG